MLAVVFGALAVYFLVGRNISPAVQDIAPTVDGVVESNEKNPVIYSITPTRCKEFSGGYFDLEKLYRKRNF